MSTKEKIELALAAMGGPKHRPEACMCDPDVGACPCHYCAELDGLNEALKVVDDNAALRALLQQMLDVAENCDETGYIDGEGFVNVDKLHADVRTALQGGAK